MTAKGSPRRGQIAENANCSDATKRMARIMGCEFVPKASCPMCCGPVDEDGMTLASEAA
jgi:hypothetical protein